MRQTILYILLLGICFIGRPDEFTDTETPETPEAQIRNSILVLKNDSSEIRTAVPVHCLSSMKFLGDTVRVNHRAWSQAVPLGEFASMEFLDSVFSEFEIRVEALSPGSHRLKDIDLVLKGKDTGSLFEMAARSDDSGAVTFSDVPTGIYSLVASDAEGEFNTATESLIFHSYRDNHTILMEENVLLPDSVSYSGVMTPEGLYDIELSWTMGEFHAEGAPFRNYMFTICLNDEFHGSTFYSYYELKGLYPGLNKIGISPISKYGNTSENAYEFEIFLDPTVVSIDNVLDSVESAEEYRYFDLNGVPVNPESLLPGIYIRTDSTGKSQKIRI